MTDADWDSVITGADQLSAAWLTAVLTQSGALSHGAVDRFEVDSERGNWSTSGTLRLHYSASSAGEREAGA